MQKGKDLVTLAEEIQRISVEKKDYITPTSQLKMYTPTDDNGNTRPLLAIDGVGTYDVGQVAHSQIADRLSIPQKYYNRMRDENPNLLSE